VVCILAKWRNINDELGMLLANLSNICGDRG
jgi:hypothetical protein